MRGSGGLEAEWPWSLRFQALLELRLAAECLDLMAVAPGKGLAVVDGVQVLDV